MSVEQFGYKQELHRALTFRDLLVYGMIFMVPIAPFGVFGYVWDGAQYQISGKTFDTPSGTVAEPSLEALNSPIQNAYCLGSEFGFDFFLPAFTSKLGQKWHNLEPPMDTIVVAYKTRKVVDCHQNLCLGLELNRIFPHCSRRDFIAASQ